MLLLLVDVVLDLRFRTTRFAQPFICCELRFAQFVGERDSSEHYPVLYTVNS